MLVYRCALFLVICLASLAPAAGEAADMDYYKNTPTYRMNTQECDEEDVGDRQVSCKYIEIGTIDGIHLTEKDRKRDPRWPKLEKYWNNTEDYLKFSGVACARHAIEAEAEKIAIDRAHRLVSSLTETFEGENFTGYLKHAGYRKGDSGWKCKSTPNTSANRSATAEERARTEEAAILDDGDEGEAAEALERAEAAAAQARAEKAAAEARRRTATFIIHNKDRYRLGLEFRSQTRKNHAWPGGNKQYVLTGTNTYELSCKVGEKICYGAWRDYQTIYWGIGKGNEGCSNCCISCGNTFEISLTDGGPDSYPSNRSGQNTAENLANIIGAVGILLNGVNSARGVGQSAPVYVPRAKRRQSDISGGNN